MELVIKISEEDYTDIKNAINSLIKNGVERASMSKICLAILDGTPLPKGHGRLGDLDKLKKDLQNYHDDCAKTSEYTRLGFETAMAAVKDANTIIEADKEQEDGNDD